MWLNCLWTLIVCRLERLQQIVSKVQMESGMCEEQINQTESLLQTVRLYILKTHLYSYYSVKGEPAWSTKQS